MSAHRASHLPHLGPGRVGLLLALVSMVLLLSALGLQFLAGLEPCQLCIWQRYPYLIVVLLGIIGFWWRARTMLVLAALVLLGNAALAAYQVGIEQGWLALSASCVAGVDATSVEELKAMLAEARPTCDQVSLTILGLSLAAWSGIAGVGLSATALLAAWRAPTVSGDMAAGALAR